MIRSKAKNITSCQRELEIDIPAERVEEKFKEVFDEIQRTTSLPGFRKGNVPRDLIEKHYLRRAEEEILQALIPESYEAALRRNNLKPISLPEIKDVNLVRGQKMNYRALVELAPEFKLKDYKAIKLKKKKIPIRDEQVDAVLKLLQEQQAELCTIKDRPARMGDYCRCDFICWIGGEKKEERKGAWFLLDKNNPVSGLAEGLCGMKLKDKKEVPVKIKGEDGRYELTLREIKEKKLPELNDEFISKMPGGLEDLAGLKKRIRKDLEARAEAEAKIDLENQLFDRLLEGLKFDLPPKLVKAEIEHIREDVRRRAAAQGVNPQDLEKEEAKIAEESERAAERRVRLYFVLNKIAEQEKISLKDDLNGRLTQQKVVEFLLTNAN